MGPGLGIQQHDSRAEVTPSVEPQGSAPVPKFSAVVSQKVPVQTAGSQSFGETVPNGANRRMGPPGGGVNPPSSSASSSVGIARARSGNDDTVSAPPPGTSNVKLEVVAPPTAAAVVANGVDKSADMASIVKKDPPVPAGKVAAPAGAPAGTPTSGGVGRGWETAGSTTVCQSLRTCSLRFASLLASLLARRHFRWFAIDECSDASSHAPLRAVPCPQAGVSSSISRSGTSAGSSGDSTKCTATVKLRGLPFSATAQEVSTCYSQTATHMYVHTRIHIQTIARRNTH